ncbi:MAG: hypothetical protein GY947_09310 [Rhodobacteraceae bacterium]|nr:hypothetical protein [Paracoccaceae bacterium]
MKRRRTAKAVQIRKVLAYVGLTPVDRPIADTVSDSPAFAREVIGETFDKDNWRKGWKQAYARGYRVQRCSVSTAQPYRANDGL